MFYIWLYIRPEQYSYVSIMYLYILILFTDYRLCIAFP